MATTVVTITFAPTQKLYADWWRKHFGKEGDTMRCKHCNIACGAVDQMTYEEAIFELALAVYQRDMVYWDNGARDVRLTPKLLVEDLLANHRNALYKALESTNGSKGQPANEPGSQTR